MFLVGELAAVVRADPAQFRRDMATVRREGDQSARQVNRSLDSVGSNLMRLGMLAKAAFSSAIVIGARQAVREFALLEGATAKFNVVFGEQAGEMEAWVENIRQRVPLARREIIQNTAALQDLMVGMGAVRSEATAMTQEWFELAAMLAAFNDVPVDQALQAIQSAIAGQSRPLRQFGIDVRETTLQQTALEEGLIKTGEAMGETERMQALLIQSYRQSQDAVNGYEDQLGSTLMAEQELGATYRDTLSIIGEELQPAYNDLLRTMNDLLRTVGGLTGAFATLWDAMKPVFEMQASWQIVGYLNRALSVVSALTNESKTLNDEWQEFLQINPNDLDVNAVTSQIQSIQRELERMLERRRERGLSTDAVIASEAFQTLVARAHVLGAILEQVVGRMESVSTEAESASRSIERFQNNIKPIDSIFDPSALEEVDFMNKSLEELVQMGETEHIIEKLFPPGSIGAIRREIQELHDELELVDPADEHRIEQLNQRIRELQKELERLGELGVDEKINEMSDASRLFTRTLADGLNQVLFQARSVSDALDGIIRQLGSRALLAGLASLFGGSAVSFGAAFFGGMRSFDGGGFTGRGARTGGLDGKGGFLAMMHPNESVIDHTKNMGLNNVQKIHVHVTGEFQDRGDALRAVVAEQTRVIERLQ